MTEQTLFTLNQAAKACARSKGTISKALSSGKLSYVSKDDSGYKIEAAELFRVFPKKTGGTGTEFQLEMPKTANENGVLQAKLDAADQRIRDLERERDKWHSAFEKQQETAANALRQLSDQREKTDSKPTAGLVVRAWRGLFGTA